MHAMGAPVRTILVVDDEESMRELLEIVLGNAGYTVMIAPDVDAACALLEKQAFDCVLTDLRMGQERKAGMDLLSWLQDNQPGVPAVMMTAYGSVDTAVEAMKRGAIDYIMKPFKNDEVRLVVQRAIEQQSLERENRAFRADQAARGKLDNIVGSSEAIEEVRDLIRRVAQLPSTVHIHGESGTGKELVARAIHHLSARSSKPFVAINCGGIPENLLESELFGHKRGSFTGAHEDKEGLFVSADGGTLFLDEVGEMPLSLQVKLLRVLDNSEVMPVGGTAARKVDVRILSATNRDLAVMANEGGFREDLYYRLNVIPIIVPPLRDRGEDIALLAHAFITSHAAKLDRPELRLSRPAEEALQAYHWPGNARELANSMERAVALCRGEEIGLSDLPPAITGGSRPAAVEDSPDELPLTGFDLEGYIEDIEKRFIKQALERGKYSQKRAAEILGLTSRSLRYRLKKYNLETE